MSLVKANSSNNDIDEQIKKCNLKDVLSFDIFIIIVSYLDCCPSVYNIWWPEKYDITIDNSCTICGLKRELFIKTDTISDAASVCSARCGYQLLCPENDEEYDEDDYHHYYHQYHDYDSDYRSDSDTDQ